ncbi:hypothetical protein [Kitasatospora sp. NPDC057223]|uniref:hypothetical protein n=1 Tax=Kitasatospora sp. NPDC057223 TaxID=3346055 RepID=UPI00363A37AA
MAAGGSGTAGGRAAARLLVLCAVLAGLFLMHGTPGAARGCHDPARTTAAHVTGAAPGHAAHPATGALRAHGDATLCVATKSRDGVALPAPGPTVAGILPVLPTALARGCGRHVVGPRGPPAAGRRLLLRVCVART